MDNEFVKECYSKVGINSQTGLYDYVINHDTATVNSVNYNLKNSNEAMEFMAKFLEALGFDVKRMYLENETKRHWFVVFSNGIKWFYYECCLSDVQGTYSFNSFNNMVTFAISKIIRSLEGVESVDSSSYELLNSYTLYEIGPLNDFELTDNINQSKKGEELLFWKNPEGSGNANDFLKKGEKLDIRDRRKGPSLVFWIVGFVVTLAIGIFLIWLLAVYYYG